MVGFVFQMEDRGRAQHGPTGFSRKAAAAATRLPASHPRPLVAMPQPNPDAPRTCLDGPRGHLDGQRDSVYEPGRQLYAPGEDFYVPGEHLYAPGEHLYVPGRHLYAVGMPPLVKKNYSRPRGGPPGHEKVGSGLVGGQNRPVEVAAGHGESRPPCQGACARHH